MAERSLNALYRESCVDNASLDHGVVRDVRSAVKERDISRRASAMLVHVRTEDELFFHE